VSDKIQTHTHRLSKNIAGDKWVACRDKIRRTQQGEGRNKGKGQGKGKGKGKPKGKGKGKSKCTGENKG
jgi:hypothetical protein